jgi:hypothetical protein
VVESLQSSFYSGWCLTRKTFHNYYSQARSSEIFTPPSDYQMHNILCLILSQLQYLVSRHRSQNKPS